MSRVAVKKAKHIHRYIRRTLTPRSTTLIYACIEPGCSHYVYPNHLVGKISLCNKCREPFVITPKLALLAKPHCKACTDEPRGVAEAIDTFPRYEGKFANAEQRNRMREEDNE